MVAADRLLRMCARLLSGALQLTTPVMLRSIFDVMAFSSLCVAGVPGLPGGSRGLTLGGPPRIQSRAPAHEGIHRWTRIKLSHTRGTAIHVVFIPSAAGRRCMSSSPAPGSCLRWPQRKADRGGTLDARPRAHDDRDPAEVRVRSRRLHQGQERDPLAGSYGERKRNFVGQHFWAAGTSSPPWARRSDDPDTSATRRRKIPDWSSSTCGDDATVRRLIGVASAPPQPRAAPIQAPGFAGGYYFPKDTVEA